jgi:acetyl esterase/lipase
MRNVNTKPSIIPLYTGDAPGSEGWNYAESLKEIDHPEGPEPRKVHFLYNVTHPTLTVYPADPAKANGTAVIVCPGGAFAFLALDYEGTEVARWFNDHGVTAVVLKYRVTHTDSEGNAITPDYWQDIIPLADADGLQAMRIIRERAKEWAIDPQRIGMIGFSAGGQVALAAATAPDAALRASFLVSIYSGAMRDVTVPKEAGPLFQAIAADDQYFAGCIPLFTAWQKAGIPSELHIYAAGGHGFSFIKRGMPVDTWPDRLKDWLGQMGYLQTA